MSSENSLAVQAERCILLLRGQKAMIDSDLAALYRVTTSALNRAVKRNLERFPDDFMFQLTSEESDSLRCQTGISNEQRGGRRYLPYAFTEQGVAMLSSVLRGERAVQVNIAIMRAFVRLRQLLSTNADLTRKLEEMEKKYDGQFKVVFDALRQLMSSPTAKPRREIGFHTLAVNSISKSKTTAKPRAKR